MLVVAIDTSEDFCSLALADDGLLLSELVFHTKMDLLRRIEPNLERLLVDNGRGPRNIDGIIVSLGPGSFTGLRIGVTIAKTLASTLEKPIAGVPTLDAIARGIAPTAANHICPMMHARTGEVFWTLFDSRAETRLADYEVGPVDGAIESAMARGGRVHFCGSGAIRAEEQIRRLAGNEAIVGALWTSFPRGAAIVGLGMKRLTTGSADDPVTLTPMYVRKPTPVVRLERGEFSARKSRAEHTLE